MPITITALYAGLNAILLVGLSIFVVTLRAKHKVDLGGGGVPQLERAIRLQGNFIEYVPLALLLLLILELNHAAGWLLHLLGAALIVARLAHAWGLWSSKGASPGRIVGTTVTWLVMAVGLIGALGYGLKVW